MITIVDPRTAARAEALFVSNLSITDHSTDAEVEAAIKHSLLTHGGTRGCAADVAAYYGDYPELAAPRMRWARSVVESLYQVPAEQGSEQRPMAARRHLAKAA